MPTLREARELRGMSQQRLADHLGVSQTAVHLWENGRASVTASTLVALTRTLGVGLDAEQPLRRSVGREVQCGTYSGSVTHVRNREEVCEPCRLARNAYENDRRVRRPRALQPCGTNAAYHRHVYAGEEACVACLGAHAAYVAARKREGN